MMAKACIQCGTTATPLWRPEVLAGPKVLCNACGVKALYSYRSRAQAVSKSKATKQQQGSKAAGPQKQPPHQVAWQSNKRRRVLSSDLDDVCVSPAQADFIKVERSHDASGKHITTWTVTDCSIDDTRQFSQAVHAQAFIDECWLFICPDKRSGKTQMLNANGRETEHANATAARQHLDKVHPSSKHEARLHEAAAVADAMTQKPAAPTVPLPSIFRQRASTPQAPSQDAKSSLIAPSSLTCEAPVPSPTLAKTTQHTPLVSASGPAATASGTAAVSDVKWPCKSAHMANVTLLHRPSKKHDAKHSPIDQMPASPAKPSVPETAPPPNAPPAVHGTAEALMPPQRPTEVALEASPSELAISDHKGTTDSHNLQTLQTVRQLRHSTSAQEVSNSNHSGFRPSCVEALGGLKASDAHRGPWPSWPSKAANKPPAAAASQAAAVLPAEASSPIRQGSSSVCSEVSMFARGVPSWGSHRPRTKRPQQPAITCAHDVDSVAAAAAAAKAETAAALAAAAAEAETAAALAAAQTLVMGGHMAEASCASELQSHLEAQMQSCVPKTGVRRRYWPEANAELPPPQHKRKRSVERDSPAPKQDRSPDKQFGKVPTSHKIRPCAEHAKGSNGTKFDSNHASTAAIEWRHALKMKPNGTNCRQSIKATAQKGPYKPHEYLGSRFCGVTGIQHSADSSLRWRAGTWDPVIKKTVYIGSYNEEEEAAAAVDAWHVSQGRNPVNFRQQGAAVAPAARRSSPVQANVQRQSGYGSDVSQDQDAMHPESSPETRQHKQAGGLDTDRSTVNYSCHPGFVRSHNIAHKLVGYRPSKPHASSSAIHSARTLVAQAAGRSPAARVKHAARQDTQGKSMRQPSS